LSERILVGGTRNRPLPDLIFGARKEGRGVGVLVGEKKRKGIGVELRRASFQIAAPAREGPVFLG